MNTVSWAACFVGLSIYLAVDLLTDGRSNERVGSHMTEDDRIIGCLPGETPASIIAGYQALQNARLQSALTAAQARIEELERWLIDALTGSVWFDGLSDEVARSTDEGVHRVEVDGVISDAGLLAAVEKAMQS